LSYAVVEVPAMAGDPEHPAAAGPHVIIGALQESGRRFPVRHVSARALGDDAPAASLQLSCRVRDSVRAVIANAETPIVLAGSCDIAPGVLAGVQRSDIGVVWIDAHADFNTPQSSVSGFWPGMTLAVVVGDCGEDAWAALEWHPVAPERVLLLGTRSLSPTEEERRLGDSAIGSVRWKDGAPEGDVDAALEYLHEHVARLYVHLDLDALDPAVGPAVVDPPVPGGLSREQLGQILTGIRERFSVAAATVATYNPAKDPGTTLSVVVDAIVHLVEGPSAHVRAGPP
jgi:arginase